MVRFIGGPWDGRAVVIHRDMVTAEIADGSRRHIYERGEMHYGNNVVEVMRHVGVDPNPRRTGS